MVNVTSFAIVEDLLSRSPTIDRFLYEDDIFTVALDPDIFTVA